MELTADTWTVSPAELRAFVAFASTDETRDHLAAVCVNRAAGWVAATDGHRLLRWSCEKVAGEPVLMSAKKLSRLLPMAERAPKKRRRRDPKPVAPPFAFSLLSETATVKASGLAVVVPYVMGRRFPPIDQVIPTYKPGDKQAGVAVDPVFFGAIALAVEAARPDHAYMRDGIVIQAGKKALDPLLVRFRSPAWTAVIMPMRWDDTWDANGKATT